MDEMSGYDGDLLIHKLRWIPLIHSIYISPFEFYEQRYMWKQIMEMRIWILNNWFKIFLLYIFTHQFIWEVLRLVNFFQCNGRKRELEVRTIEKKGCEHRNGESLKVGHQPCLNLIKTNVQSQRNRMWIDK